MANVLSRTPPYRYLRSVNDPLYPTVDWIHNPDMSATVGFDSKYWTVTGDTVSVVDQAARDAIDAAELASVLAAERAIAQAKADDPVSIEIRALILNANKRCNLLAQRIIELQDALLAVKASSGAVQSIRDALPASYLPTGARPLPAAIVDYKTDIANLEAG